MKATATIDDRNGALSVRSDVHFSGKTLMLGEGDEMSRSKLLNLPVPQADAVPYELEGLLAEFDPDAAEAAMAEQVNCINGIVGSARASALIDRARG